MATKEEISMVGFEIVAYAGDAQTDLLAALDAAREGDDDQLIAGLLLQRRQLAGQGLFLLRRQQLGVIDHPSGQGRELDLGGEGRKRRQPQDEHQQERRDQSRRLPVPHHEGGRGHVRRIRPPEQARPWAASNRYGAPVFLQ